MYNNKQLEDLNKINKSLENQIIIIPKGITLYRAISCNNIKKIINKNNNLPMCVFDNDTYKTGCYFAVITSLLSDFMALEYNKNMYVYEYILNNDLIVNIGKYTETSITNNHIDFEIRPISLNYDFDNKNSPKSFELFIDYKYVNEEYLSFIDKKFITVNDVKNKYKYLCFNYTHKQIHNMTLNTTLNFYNYMISTNKINKDNNKLIKYQIIENKEINKINHEYYIKILLIYQNVENNKISSKYYEDKYFAQ